MSSTDYPCLLLEVLIPFKILGPAIPRQSITMPIKVKSTLYDVASIIKPPAKLPATFPKSKALAK